MFDNTPDPAANVVYHNYKARVYEVTSSENLSSVLDQASKELGKPIDLIYFSGHANNQVMKLNSNYFFTANLIETNAINKNISSTAHIILAGCETAKPDSDFKSLAKLVSQRLPKALVTGFSELLYPSYSWSWFNEGLKIKAQHPLKGNSIVKNFKNGRLVA